MGDYVDGRYEAVYDLDQSTADLWAKLDLSDEAGPLWLQVWPRMPGFDITGEVVKSEPAREMQIRKTSEPCKGSLISLVLEPHNGGTRLTVIQAELPEWVESAVDLFVAGGDQISADLMLFLDRGVLMARHSMPWAFSGITVNEVASGLQVAGIVPGCYGERLGLQSGDLLLTLAGAPVLTSQCLQTLMRVLHTGDEVAAVWVTGRDRHEGSAVL